jgi:hypothetical protein
LELRSPNGTALVLLRTLLEDGTTSWKPKMGFLKIKNMCFGKDNIRRLRGAITG